MSVERVSAKRDVVIAARDIVVSFLPAGGVSTAVFIFVAITVVTMNFAGLEDYTCRRLDLCMTSIDHITAVEALGGPLYTVRVNRPRREPSIETVGGGYLVFTPGTDALMITDDPPVAADRLRTRPADDGAIAALARRLASLPPQALVSVLRIRPGLSDAHRELADALQARLDGPLRQQDCVDVADSAWHLEARSELGAEAQAQDRLQLSLRAVALDCDASQLPPGI